MITIAWIVGIWLIALALAMLLISGGKKLRRDTEAELAADFADQIRDGKLYMRERR